MLQLEIALMATSWAHLAIMAASLATQVTLLVNLESHLASPKVCLGTLLGSLHRLGTWLGLAILAATSLGLARLSKWPHRCTVCSTYCREKKCLDSSSTILEIRS